MSRFNATDAIFFGFRVVKQDPILIAVLAALTAAVSLISIQFVWPELVALTTAAEELSQPSAGGDPTETFSDMMAAYGGFFGSAPVLTMLLADILIWLIAQGAILRVLVRDHRDGWVAGLQLGGDELRILVVSIVVGVVMFLIYLLAVIAVSLVVGVMAVASRPLAAFVGVLAVIGVALGMMLIGARLSAAAPASVGERKFIVFGSWRLTQGRMWGLLGAYVVLFFIMFVAILFVFALTAVLAPQASAVMQGMTPPGALDNPGAAFRSPGYVVLTLVNAAVNIVITAARAGVGAYAYRTLGQDAGYPNAHPPQAGAAATV